LNLLRAIRCSSDLRGLISINAARKIPIQSGLKYTIKVASAPRPSNGRTAAAAAASSADALNKAVSAGRARANKDIRLLFNDDDVALQYIHYLASYPILILDISYVFNE
jgi:hypothetical protein